MVNNEGRGNSFTTSAGITVALGFAFIAAAMYWLRPQPRVVEQAKPVQAVMPMLPLGDQLALAEKPKEPEKPPEAPVSKWDGLWQRPEQIRPAFEMKQSGGVLTGKFIPPVGNGALPFTGGKVMEDEVLFTVDDPAQNRYHIHMKLLENGDARAEMWMAQGDALLMLQRASQMGRNLQERKQIVEAAQKEANAYKNPVEFVVFRRVIVGPGKTGLDEKAVAQRRAAPSSAGVPGATGYGGSGGTPVDPIRPGETMMEWTRRLKAQMPPGSQQGMGGRGSPPTPRPLSLGSRRGR